MISSICRICFYLKFEVLISNDCNLFKFSFPSIIFASFSLGPFLFNGPLPFFIYSFRLSIFDGRHFCYDMHLDWLTLLHCCLAQFLLSSLMVWVPGWRFSRSILGGWCYVLSRPASHSPGPRSWFVANFDPGTFSGWLFDSRLLSVVPAPWQPSSFVQRLGNRLLHCLGF